MATPQTPIETALEVHVLPAGRAVAKSVNPALPPTG